MSQDTGTPPAPHYQVPGAVHEATRSLLRLRSGGDARRVAEHLVQELGGHLVPAGTDDPGALPLDVSFGEDAARNRKDNGPANIAVIRRRALDVARLDQSKG